MKKTIDEQNKEQTKPDFEGCPPNSIEEHVYKEIEKGASKQGVSAHKCMTPEASKEIED